MLATSARLLRLLSLLQSRQFWRGPELAERLEIDPRTLRRDVDRLRALGYPVDAQSGVAGGYALGAGAKLPPLSLEDDEALAVAVALRTATNTLSASVGEAALRALTKLERVFPQRLQGRARALRDRVHLLEHDAAKVSTTLLSLLAEACDGRQLTSFDYASSSSAPARRQVEPVGLVHTGRWYLVAFDRLRDDWRTFRVDRMSRAKAARARFAARPLPENGDLRAFVSRSISLGAYAHEVVLIFHAPIKDVMARVTPSTAVLRRLDDRRTHASLGGNSLAGLAAWIAMLDFDFEVVAPPELLVAMREVRDRIDAALERA